MIRRIVRLVAVMLLCCVTASVTGCGGGDDNNTSVVTETQWGEKVHTGMTADEVNASLGRPPDREFKISGETWYYWRFGNDEGGVTYGGSGQVVGVRWINNMYGS